MLFQSVSIMPVVPVPGARSGGQQHIYSAGTGTVRYSAHNVSCLHNATNRLSLMEREREEDAYAYAGT